MCFSIVLPFRILNGIQNNSNNTFIIFFDSYYIGNIKLFGLKIHGGKHLPISKETLRKMISDFQLIELSDQELNRILPDLKTYLVSVKRLRSLDLTKVPPARLLRTQE